jgi:multiple sugar transport system substrate-binding protein
MSMLVITAGSVISIVILFMIFVKDIDGTQDDNTITLMILFNQIVTSPNAGKVLIDNALEVLRNQTDVPINVK